MASSKAKSWVSAAREDPVIVRAGQLQEESEKSINLERVSREVRVLHESRTSRKLYKIALEPTSLAEAAMRDMSARARLTELKASVYSQQLALEAAYEAAAAQLVTKYGDGLRDVATNAADRKHVTNRILSGLVSRVSELSAAVDNIDLIVKDIDQASFALRNATEMLKLLIERKNQIL